MYSLAAGIHVLIHVFTQTLLGSPPAANEYNPLLLPPSAFARVRRPAAARPWERAATRSEACFYCMHEAIQALLERGCSGAGAGARVQVLVLASDQ